MNCQARSELTHLWYAYRNVLYAHNLLYDLLGKYKDDRNRLNFAGD